MLHSSRFAYRRDPDLIRACLNRDVSAWKELVERYSRLVYSIPLRYGFPLVDADQVYQNVFRTVYDYLGRLPNDQCLAPWLVTVTHRETRRIFAQRSDRSSANRELLNGDAPPPEQVQKWVRQHLVHQALAQLEPSCRELLLVLFLDDKLESNGELTVRCEVPADNVSAKRVHCFRELETILMDIGTPCREDRMLL